MLKESNKIEYKAVLIDKASFGDGAILAQNELEDIRGSSIFVSFSLFISTVKLFVIVCHSNSGAIGGIFCMPIRHIRL